MKSYVPSPMALLLTVMATAAALAVAGDGDCAARLVAIFPCLPYVSSPPNNESSSVSVSCCGPVLGMGSFSACLCHLILQPSLLGFPLNTTRLLSLPSLCQSLQSTNKNPSTTTIADITPPFSCQGDLPPLHSSEGFNSSSPSARVDSSSPSSPPTLVPAALKNGATRRCLLSTAFIMLLIFYPLLLNAFV